MAQTTHCKPSYEILIRVLTGDYEKHQSGLSDMLAAFPPPAHPVAQTRRSWRESVRDEISSWPLPARFSGMGRSRDTSPRDQQPALPTYNIAGSGNGGDNGGNQDPVASNARAEKKPGRRCCGLPLCGFIILVIVLLIIVTAAVVIPVEFFVVRRRANNGAGNAQPELTDCQNMLTCANGGTNVVTSEGVCSCICTGGFTGATCTVPGANGCTTTNVVDQGPSVGNNVINNVTLGDSLPRLIQAASQNFSIPLSVTQILAKFNAGSLSCLAENALVTFNGESAPGNGPSQAVIPGSTNNAAEGPKPELPQVPEGVALAVVTVVVRRQAAQTFSTTLSGSVSFPSSRTSIPPTTTTTVTISVSRKPSSSSSSTTTSSPSSSATTSRSPPASTSTTRGNPPPTPSTFPVTDQMLDFARVSVLFVLQQETLQNAEAAQLALQGFFTAAGQGSAAPSPVTPAQARNLTLGNGNSVNLIDFTVDVGGGPVGRAAAPAATPLRALRLRDAVPQPESSPCASENELKPPPLMRMFRR